MAHGKVTLFGMEHYLNLENDSMFKDIVLPTAVDKDTFLNQLMLTGGEFALLYMDPDFMKTMVTHWSYKNLVPFTRIFEAYNKTYDPLSNYDRTEEFSDSEVSLGSEESNNSSSGSSSSAGNTVNSLSSRSDITGSETGKVSAFDDSNFSNKDQKDTSSSANGNEQGSNISNEETSESHSDNGSRNTNNSRTSVHSGRLYGNIGITSSQQLLEAELSLRSKFNPYDLMVDSFIQEFLIPVYA